MTESDDGDERPRSLLADCLADPERAKRRLPAVVGLLEADDEVTRLAAAWTCCLVATTDPDTVEYVVRRLSDRLDGEVSLELTHALDYLADRYPETVEAVLTELDSESADAHDRRRFSSPESGSFTRNHYYTREPTRQGVGRVRLPGTEGRSDPRRTYTRGRPDEREIAAAREELADADEAETQGDAADGEANVAPEDVPDGADGAASENDEAVSENDEAVSENDEVASENDEVASEDDEVASEGDEVASEGDATSSAGTLVRRTTEVSAIAARSRFDRLHVLASQDRSRYSEDYRALVGRGGEEQAVSLRLLDLPDAIEVRPDFEADAGEALARWSEVDDHPHVLPLLDWGVEPRPWLATTFAGESLAGGDPLPHERALSDAIALADAVSHVHRKDVVHGGIDPGNVAYPGDVLDDNDQEPPLLNNVGLLLCFRRYVNPTTVLDPRYAAPEYYDRRFGVVDAATDVYQLGTVIYSIYTGRPPFAGSFEEVRDAVTSPATPVPGDVRDDVPAAIDDVVSKAMAAQKLTRYEAVEHLRADLRSIEEDTTP